MQSNCVDVKYTTWGRHQFSEETDLQEIANRLKSGNLDQSELADLEGFENFSYICEVEEFIEPEENEGAATIEIYNNEGRIIWENVLSNFPKRKREKISVEDLYPEHDVRYSLNFDDDFKDFNWIEDVIVDVDMEKGSKETYTILQRKSDKKFFQIEWNSFPHGGGNDIHEQTMEEVFPIYKTTVSYE